MSDSGISWATCKSAPHSRQTTTPAPHRSVFLQAGCPSCRPINSVKALKAEALKAENPFYVIDNYYFILHGLLLNPDMLLHAAPRALVMRMQPVATDGVASCVMSRQ